MDKAVGGPHDSFTLNEAMEGEGKGDKRKPIFLFLIKGQNRSISYARGIVPFRFVGS